MSNKLQRIEDVERPVVGQSYLVPSIWHKYYGGPGSKRIWMPVIGPWHEDNDIGVQFFHFHYDVRFVPTRLLKWKDRPASTLGRVASVYLEGNFNPGSPQDQRAAPDIEYRRWRMLREMPEFPRDNPNSESLKKNRILQELEPKFKDVKLKDCLTCPHRGMSLKNLPRNADGTVVCNGHGLKWNLETRCMVVR